MRSKVLRRTSEYWFETLDTGNSGALTKEAFSVFLRKKLKLKKDDVEEMIERTDSNDDNRIDLQEFEGCMAQARAHRRKDIQAMVIRDAMMVVILFHPFVSGLAMKAFKCVDITSSGEPDKSVLATDMTIECSTTSKWIGIIAFSGSTILLFSIGAPVSLLVTLVRRRNKLGEKSTYKRLGILYSAWRPAWYFFEPVELMMKLLLWVAVVVSAIPL